MNELLVQKQLCKNQDWMICGFIESEVSRLQSVKPPVVWVEAGIFDEDIKDEQVKKNDEGKYVDSTVWHYDSNLNLNEYQLREQQMPVRLLWSTV